MKAASRVLLQYAGCGSKARYGCVRFPPDAPSAEQCRRDGRQNSPGPRLPCHTSSRSTFGSLQTHALDSPVEHRLVPRISTSRRSPRSSPAALADLGRIRRRCSACRHAVRGSRSISACDSRWWQCGGFGSQDGDRRLSARTVHGRLVRRSPIRSRRRFLATSCTGRGGRPTLAPICQRKTPRTVRVRDVGLVDEGSVRRAWCSPESFGWRQHRPARRAAPPRLHGFQKLCRCHHLAHIDLMVPDATLLCDFDQLPEMSVDVMIPPTVPCSAPSTMNNARTPWAIIAWSSLVNGGVTANRYRRDPAQVGHDVGRGRICLLPHRRELVCRRYVSPGLAFNWRSGRSGCSDGR